MATELAMKTITSITTMAAADSSKKPESSGRFAQSVMTIGRAVKLSRSWARSKNP